MVEPTRAVRVWYETQGYVWVAGQWRQRAEDLYVSVSRSNSG